MVFKLLALCVVEWLAFQDPPQKTKQYSIISSSCPQSSYHADQLSSSWRKVTDHAVNHTPSEQMSLTKLCQWTYPRETDR